MDRHHFDYNNKFVKKTTTSKQASKLSILVTLYVLDEPDARSVNKRNTRLMP